MEGLGKLRLQGLGFRYLDRVTQLYSRQSSRATGLDGMGCIEPGFELLDVGRKPKISAKPYEKRET